jgi:predicted metalloprotease with PDZ domain
LFLPLAQPREEARLEDGGLAAQDSIGLTLSGDGRITEVVPGMSGDRAGLAPGMKVIGVNEKTFSHQRLLDALVDSVKLHRIELLLIEGDRLRTVAVEYSRGLRYFVLERDESRPDMLAQILKPRTAAPEGNAYLAP